MHALASFPLNIIIFTLKHLFHVSLNQSINQSTEKYFGKTSSSNDPNGSFLVFSPRLMSCRESNRLGAAETRAAAAAVRGRDATQQLLFST